MPRVSRNKYIIGVCVLALVVAAAVLAIVAFGGGDNPKPAPVRVVGGDVAVGRAFGAFQDETDVSCTDSTMRNPSDNLPIYLCTGTYTNGTIALCRPTVWDAKTGTVAYPDKYGSPVDNGMGALTC